MASGGAMTPSRLVVELGNELIANSGNRLDEPPAVSAVAQRFPDFPNPLGQGVLDDVHVRPDSLEQFILGEDSTSVLEEMQQELECLRRKIDVFARAEQAALGPVQHEIAEPKYWKLPHESAAAPAPIVSSAIRQRVVKTSACRRSR